jgi:hypothetical protein
LFHLVVGEDLHRHSLLSNPIDLSIKYLKLKIIYYNYLLNILLYLLTYDLKIGAKRPGTKRFGAKRLGACTKCMYVFLSKIDHSWLYYCIDITWILMTFDCVMEYVEQTSVGSNLVDIRIPILISMRLLSACTWSLWDQCSLSFILKLKKSQSR